MKTLLKKIFNMLFGVPFRLIMTVMFPFEAAVARKTSFVWMLTSFIGLYTIPHDDNGRSFDLVIRDGLPTSKLLTKLLQPLNRGLYLLHNFLEHQGDRLWASHRIVAVILLYTALQVIGIRIFVAAWMRFSGVMILSALYTAAKVHARKQEALKRKNGTYLAPEDREMDKSVIDIHTKLALLQDGDSGAGVPADEGSVPSAPRKAVKPARFYTWYDEKPEE